MAENGASLANADEERSSGDTRMTGAQIVIKALIDQHVEHIFGYPGGAVLPIYDEIFQQDSFEHILVRHEQAAGFAAEGYARSTGKVGVMLVTSGPGATNAVTPLQDALMDSIPIVCISGQVPTNLIGTDAFQEADTVGITRPCTKHNYLVKDVNRLASTLHEAFRIAQSGRPGPVLIDIPKDIQFAHGVYTPPQLLPKSQYHPRLDADLTSIHAACELMRKAERPVVYSGGGVVNSGAVAVRLLRELVDLGDFPITSTLMGLGCYPASGENWLGMLGMHGTYEANLAMHECDVMLAVGARFDDRITGRLDAFAPNAKIIHIDIDPSSINKNVQVDVALIGDVAHILEPMVRHFRTFADGGRGRAAWWEKLNLWRKRKSLAYQRRQDAIMPQYAIERLFELTRERKPYITTEVGQHQMWTAQHFGFDEPRHMMTSGGLGSMGYGFPSAIGVKIAHPDRMVICVAGDASIQMNIQELATAVQHNAAVKVFILNNQYMGMVRQWQQLLHGNRLSHTYTDAMPDFVQLAEAYGAVGLSCATPQELDGKILQMIASDKPVLFDCRVVNLENCFPMIPSGRAHNDMLLPDEVSDDVLANAIDDAGRSLV